MASDPQSLLTQAQCYQCYASDRGMMTLLKLALLRQIALAQNPGAAVDAQSLLSAANCFSCFGANPGLLMLLKLALLAEWDAGEGATDTSSATMLAEAGCYDCFGGTPGLNGLMELALLAQVLVAENPAADVTPQTLLSQVSCYACLLPGQWALIELSLLCLIAGGPCDPQTLLAGVACYECLLPGQWGLLVLALLADILEKKISPITNTLMIINLAAPFVSNIPHADVSVDYPVMTGAQTITLPDTVDTAEDLTLTALTGGFLAESDYLTSLSFPALATIATNFTINSGPQNATPLATVSFVSLASIGGAFNVNNVPAVGVISMPSLATVGSTFSVTGNDITGTLSFPALTTTGDDITIGEDSVTEVSFPNLTTINGGSILDTSVCAALVTLNIPALVNVTNISASNGLNTVPGLTTVNVPAVLKANSVTINGSALTQTVVDNILIALVAGAQTNGNVDLGGGTSATPGATGITAKATLITRGWDVTTN